MNFLLPIEVSSRELMAKLFMAHQFAMDGHVSYLGEKKNILNLSKYVSPAVYFDKGYHKGVSDKNYSFLKKHGASIVSLDEENAVDFKDSQQLNLRFPDEILDEFDLIFLWGKRQYDFLSENRKNFDPNKVVVSGHPRFELLKSRYHQLYENDSANYSSNYGDYILINTNFGLGNNVKSESDVINNYINRFPQVKKLIEYQKMQVGNFISLAKLISKETSLNVVLRPHPEESHDVYIKAFETYPNIHVVYEGSVIPWIMASRIMVHHDCTTSLEAAMLGKCSIAFAKDISQQLTTDIPLKISYYAESFKDVLNLIQTRTYNSNINKELLRDYFAFHEPSVIVIRENLKRFITKDKKHDHLLLGFLIKNYIKSIVRFFFNKESELFRQKFEGFNIEEARKIIEVFNSINSVSINIEIVNKYLFKIYRKL
jgi:surface carbohydrate biosynthesis protein